MLTILTSALLAAGLVAAPTDEPTEPEPTAPVESEAPSPEPTEDYGIGDALTIAPGADLFGLCGENDTTDIGARLYNEGTTDAGFEIILSGVPINNLSVAPGDVITVPVVSLEEGQIETVMVRAFDGDLFDEPMLVEGTCAPTVPEDAAPTEEPTFGLGEGVTITQEPQDQPTATAPDAAESPRLAETGPNTAGALTAAALVAGGLALLALRRRIA